MIDDGSSLIVDSPGNYNLVVVVALLLLQSLIRLAKSYGFVVIWWQRNPYMEINVKIWYRPLSIQDNKTETPSIYEDYYLRI